MVDSPCVEVCRMDPAKDVCAGCWRTLDEISRWRDMSDPERTSVIEAIAQRKRVKVISEKVY